MVTDPSDSSSDEAPPPAQLQAHARASAKKEKRDKEKREKKEKKKEKRERKDRKECERVEKEQRHKAKHDRRLEEDADRAAHKRARQTQGAPSPNAPLVVDIPGAELALEELLRGGLAPRPESTTHGQLPGLICRPIGRSGGSA